MKLDIDKKNILKLVHYAKGLISNALGAFIALITQIVLARIMGVSDYGLITLTLTIVLLASKLSDFGLIAATHRYISVRIGEENFLDIKSIIAKSGLVLFIVSAVLTCMFLFSADLLGRWFDNERLEGGIKIFAIFIPAIFIQKWFLTILKGLGKNVTRIHIEITLQNILVAALSIGLYMQYKTPSAVLIGHGIAYIITAVISTLWAKKYYLELYTKNVGKSVTTVKNLIVHGLPVNFAAMGQKLLSRGDVLVIGFLLGETAVGLYKAAYTLASGVKLLVAPISSYVAFLMGKDIGKKDKSKILHYYDLSVVTSLMFTLPLYIILIAFAEGIVTNLYGDPYEGAKSLLQILSIGFSIFICTGPMSVFFNAIGRNWVRMWIVLLAGIVNILMNYFLILKIGVNGAAISTTLSFLLIYYVFSQYVKYSDVVEERTKINLQPAILIITSATLSGGIYSMDLNNLWLDIVYTLLCASIVFIMAGWFSFLIYSKFMPNEK